MASSTTLVQLRADVIRLQTDNEDLRASAKRWADLYESAMQRAMELEALLAGLRDQVMHSEDENKPKRSAQIKTPM